MAARSRGRISAFWRRPAVRPALRSKRSRARVAPGPLRNVFPRLTLRDGGAFVCLPCPSRGVIRGAKPDESKPALQRPQVLLELVLHDLGAVPNVAQMSIDPPDHLLGAVA